MMRIWMRFRTTRGTACGTICGMTCAALFAVCALSAGAVEVDEEANHWIISTDLYTLHMKIENRAGYDQAFPTPGPDAVSLFGEGQIRNFYHAANYDGWVHWGNIVDAEVVSNANKTLIMQFEMDDGNSKEYHITATYWDGAPYWKHELVVKATKPVLSLSNGHEPMVEPRNGLGNNNEYLAWEDPIPHVAFANGNGYFALYTEVGTTFAAPAWAPDGRMHLLHNDLGVQLAEGQSSDPLVYYMAIGPGDLDDAHELAETVTEEPASLSVDPIDRLAARWAELKRNR